MGFLDLFRRKKTNDAKVEKVVTKTENKTQNDSVNNESKKEFVADISLFEFHNVDWEDFGRLLKQNKILPNSYVKKPTEVEIKLGKTGRPMVMLTFNSATSTSERKFMLLQDGVFQYVNGAIDDGKDPDLNKVWNRFKEEIRYLNLLNTNREEYFQKQRADRAIKNADRTKEVLTDLYEKEQEFLEKYKDVKFDGFYYTAIFEKDNRGFTNYAGEYPHFFPLIEVENGWCRDGEPVMPFTPKTLEHCILNMTNGQKAEDGEHLEYFVEKCKKIQEFSCYESEDWDKVIEIGKEIVKNQYIVSTLTDEEDDEKEL